MIVYYIFETNMSGNHRTFLAAVQRSQLNIVLDDHLDHWHKPIVIIPTDAETNKIDFNTNIVLNNLIKP